MLLVMLFANFVFIHGLGLGQLSYFLSVIGKPAKDFVHLLWLGTIPFIPGDITKVIAAALLTRVITPKTAYNGEIDKRARFWRLP